MFSLFSANDNEEQLAVNKDNIFDLLVAMANPRSIFQKALGYGLAEADRGTVKHMEYNVLGPR